MASNNDLIVPSPELTNKTIEEALKVLKCFDCNKLIIPPIGKPFSNGDDKTRCAACAVEFYMKHPGAGIMFKNKPIFNDCLT